MHSYATVSGVVFAVVATGQILRLAFGLAVQVADMNVPLWPSAIAALIAGTLSVWAFRVRAEVGSRGAV